MTCHANKRENILVQIEKDGKGEIGNREKKRKKKGRNCSITPER